MRSPTDERKFKDINRRLEQARLKRQEAFERRDGKALLTYFKYIKIDSHLMSFHEKHVDVSLFLRFALLS